MNSTPNPLRMVIAGSADFRRRTGIRARQSSYAPIVSEVGLGDAWGKILEEKPDLLLVEIGVRHDPDTQLSVRRLLTMLRERHGTSIRVVLALMSPETLYYGGDLLFEDETSLTPSGLIDSFVAAPPAFFPSVPGIGDQIENIIEHYSEERDRVLSGATPLPPLAARSWVHSLADPASRELWMRWLPRYAAYTNESPIVIGETGTGKTRLASALHSLSGRAGEFIMITPRDFSSSELVQAELFGAVAGAYTGAVDKWGMVKSAENGTLFIDELQSIDKDLQGKLITFIENKTYRRVGSAETVEADVRFVFASNRTLYDMIRSNTLRDDFAYRLERLQLELPALRERKLDIAAALAFSFAKIRRQRPYETKITGVSSSAYTLLFSHQWPGNLRQLENTAAKLCELADMEHASLVSDRAAARALESRLAGEPVSPAEALYAAATQCSSVALTEQLKSIDDTKERLVHLARSIALEANAGDVQRAAEMIDEDPSVMALFAQTQEEVKDLP